MSRDAELSRIATVTQIRPGAGDQAVVDDALEALLLAQHGYRAAVQAVDAAKVPSLTDFLG